jgi:hypothetical protein
MSCLYPGGETLAILQPTGSGTDRLNQAITQLTVVAWVYGCAFEPYTRGPIEEQTDTITSHERAWAFLPYVQGVGVPTVDSGGNPVVDGGGNPVPVVINNNTMIQPVRANDAVAQRNYKVQGLPEIEFDIDGQPEYAWVVCEWHGG